MGKIKKSTRKFQQKQATQLKRNNQGPQKSGDKTPVPMKFKKKGGPKVKVVKKYGGSDSAPRYQKGKEEAADKLVKLDTSKTRHCSIDLMSFFSETPAIEDTEEFKKLISGIEEMGTLKPIDLAYIKELSSVGGDLPSEFLDAFVYAFYVCSHPTSFTPLKQMKFKTGKKSSGKIIDDMLKVGLKHIIDVYSKSFETISNRISKTKLFAQNNHTMHVFTMSVLDLFESALENTETDVFNFLLAFIAKNIIYFSFFKETRERLLMMTINLLDNEHEQDEEGGIIINDNIANEILMSLAEQSPYPFIDNVLRLSTISYFNLIDAKYSAASIEEIENRENMLIDLYSIDPTCAYKQCYLFIRDITLDVQVTEEKHKKIRNWRHLMSLKLFSKIIKMFHQSNPDSQFVHLLYPVVELCHSSIKCLSNPLENCPYIFELVKNLMELCQPEGGEPVYDNFPFVTVVSDLVRVLEQLQEVEVDFSSKPPASKKKNKKKKQTEDMEMDVSAQPEDESFQFQIAVSHSETNTLIFQHWCFGTIVKLLKQQLKAYECNIGFCELSHPIIYSMEQFSATTNNVQLMNRANNFCKKIKELEKSINQHRSTANFNPVEAKKIHDFSYKLSTRNDLKKLIQNLSSC